MIDVVIPVGPFPGNRRWLKECLDSVRNQTLRAAHILLIDDSAGSGVPGITECEYGADVRIYRNPWRSGVAHSFNFGVALATNDPVFLLGSDDTIEPTCLEACWDAYRANERRAAYYWLDVRYLSTGNTQSIACNAALVTKKLWDLTGGIPIESACGAPDAALLSCLIAKAPNLMVRVPSDPERPLYNYRDHEETDTLRRKAWHSLIIDIRGLVTEEWQKR